MKIIRYIKNFGEHRKGSTGSVSTPRAIELVVSRKVAEYVKPKTQPNAPASTSKPMAGASDAKELAAKLSTAEGKIKELAKYGDEAEKYIADAKKWVDQAEEKIEKLEGDLTNERKVRVEAEEKAKASKSAMLDLGAKSAKSAEEQAEKIDKLEGTVADMAVDNKDLSDSNDALKREIASLKGKVTKLENKLAKA